LYFGQFNSTADKRVTNGWWTGQPSPTTIMLNVCTYNDCKAWRSFL